MPATQMGAVAISWRSVWAWHASILTTPALLMSCWPVLTHRCTNRNWGSMGHSDETPLLRDSPPDGHLGRLRRKEDRRDPGYPSGSAQTASREKGALLREEGAAPSEEGITPFNRVVARGEPGGGGSVEAGGHVPNRWSGANCE